MIRVLEIRTLLSSSAMKPIAVRHWQNINASEPNADVSIIRTQCH